MRPDDGCVDHVGAGISLDHIRQAFQHGIENTDLQPAPVTAEDAVPFAVVVREMPPLRARPRQPHHALEVAAVVLRRSATAPALGRQQRTDQRPFLVRQTDTLAQGFLQKEALNQSASLRSSFVHET